MLNYLEKRQDEIKHSISLSDKVKMIDVINSLDTYVDCNSCQYYGSNSNDKLCTLEGHTVPMDLVWLGCGKGVEDIPF